MNGAYEENKLLNRLFGSYRMSFVAGDGCSLDENDGKQLYAESPEQVPLEEYFKISIPESMPFSLNELLS